MSQEVVQWLNEIKTLKQDVADRQVQLAEANVNAEKWRQRYETEAKQRRQEADAAAAAIAQLQATINQLQTAITPSDLTLDRDRLTTALQTEKAAHEQTRKDLTTALSDAMELLSKGKGRLPDIAGSEGEMD
jgi:DNA-binding protein H-NS